MTSCSLQGERKMDMRTNTFSLTLYYIQAAFITAFIVSFSYGFAMSIISILNEDHIEDPLGMVLLMPFLTGIIGTFIGLYVALPSLIIWYAVVISLYKRGFKSFFNWVGSGILVGTFNIVLYFLLSDVPELKFFCNDLYLGMTPFLIIGGGLYGYLVWKDIKY